MDISQFSRIDPRNEAILNQIANEEPNSKIIFQQSFSPTGFQKGLSNAPLLFILLSAIPIFIFFFFIFSVFSSVPSGLAPPGFSSIILLIFMIPIFMLVIFMLFGVFGRKFLKQNIAVSRTYAVIETPADLILINIKDGSIDGIPKKIPKNSIRRVYYQETPVRRLGNHRTWGTEIYSQLLIEFETSGMPMVETLAQSPKYQANNVFALKSYLEQQGFPIENDSKEIICPSCNSRAPSGATFCENCGFNLSKTSSLT